MSQKYIFLKSVVRAGGKFKVLYFFDMVSNGTIEMMASVDLADPSNGAVVEVKYRLQEKMYKNDKGFSEKAYRFFANEVIPV